MRLTSIETTPNPHSMKLNLDESFSKPATYTCDQRKNCPDFISRLLDIEGVKSVFVCHDFVTLNKDPRSDWRQILDAATCIFSGSKDSVSANVAQRQAAEKQGQVQVFVQTFRGVPVQVKVVDGEGEKRLSLPVRFNEAVQRIQQSTGADYLKERYWADWGVRYDTREQVAAEVADEITGTRDDKALEHLVAVAVGKVTESVLPKDKDSLQADLKCDDWHRRLKAVQELGILGTAYDAVKLLTQALLCDSNPQVRRLAAAALGATGNTAAVAPLCNALINDANVGVRRTAGDALSDIGDSSAQSEVCCALSDPNKLVRWRAARFLFEVGTEEALPLLEKAQEDPEFEVRLEIQAAIERIKGGESGSMPAWKKIVQVEKQ